MKGIDEVYSTKGDHIILPLSPKYQIQPVKSGFGFSSTTNEYKVIRILEKGSDKHFKAEAEIFTLGSDSWRMIEAFPYPSCFDQNLFLNGNLHWMTFENMELFSSQVIVSFNVGTEELDVMQPPPYAKQQRVMFKDLRVLGENLWFIDADFDFQIDVWVMKNYGVATSWVKEYVIKRKSDSVSLYWCKNYEVMKLWNGELLMRCGDHTLGYYDPEKGTFKPITVHEMPDVDYVIRPPIMLSGSLFSPQNVHKQRNR
ncbi:F-box protein [Thalictrum thalictroides]|uniref:F-box protein n=1 Tax=Thalictrum thalictroides TaxID=46969 RepID=A0A7J6WZH7_THATH|nr:F-box protein [Thalictrum thalictroides]